MSTVARTENMPKPEIELVLDAAFYIEAEDVLRQIKPEGTEVNFAYYKESNGLTRQYGEKLGSRLNELFDIIKIEALPTIGEPFEAGIASGDVAIGTGQIEQRWHVDRAIGLRKHIGSYAGRDTTTLTRFASGAVPELHPLNRLFRELFITQRYATVDEFNGLVNEFIGEGALELTSAEPRGLYGLDGVIHRSGVNITDRPIRRTFVGIMTRI